MKLSLWVVTLLVGVGIGWSARSVFDTDGLVESAVDVSMHGVAEPQDHSATVDVTIRTVESDRLPANAELATRFDTDEKSRETLEDFIALLKENRFGEAMTFFSRAERVGRLDVAQLKKALLEHLQQLMQRDQKEDFVDLTDEYLSIYYDDIDVLLLLAEFDRLTEFYPEAISVFQRAYEYAYTIGQREKVDAAFDDFFDRVDVHLISLENGYSLGQLYLQADIAGLLSPRQRLRQAQVFIDNGDVYLGRQILSELLGERAVADAARAMLAGSGEQEAVAQRDALNRRYVALPLKRRGNQFLIDIRLDKNEQNRLLIDTGASMTTLSRRAFESLRDTADMKEVGRRMFSTANGMTKGSVYRARRLALGEFELQNVLVAVLDFDMSSGVDGLLGMNVLDKFRFQLDQENDQLLLSPRAL